jgi:Fe-S-cluster containining protein
MAALLDMSPEEFSTRYVEVSSQGPRLATANGFCIFLQDHRCRVHPVKPFICRQWPFLPALLVDAEELEQAKGACPGIDPACSHEDFVDAAMSAEKVGD